MQNSYVYIFACVAMVSIGISIMYYFTSSQSSNFVATPIRQGTADCIGYLPKAKQLAENSLGQGTMSSYNLQTVSIQCVWGNDQNGSRILLGVKLEYTSNKPSIGLLTITEDPQFTKVINATVMPALKFSGSSG